VKLAVGAEYLKTWLQQQGNVFVGNPTISGNDGVGAPAVTVADPLHPGVMVTLIPATTDIPIRKDDQTVWSAFGELVIPIFGPENARPGFDRLTVSGSVRYDHYDKFGSTVNPKVGATYKPVNWLTFRGAWGTSFNAPSPADGETLNPKGAQFTRLDVQNFTPPPGSIAPPPTDPATQYTLVTTGGNDDLDPQEATTWSVGTDIDVPFLEGLRISATYWNIYFKGFISTTSALLPLNDSFYANASDFYIINPTAAELAAALDGATITVNPSTDPQPTSPSQVYLIRNGQSENLGQFKTDGLDFSVSYRTDTSFGSIDLRSNASYLLSQKRQFGDAPYFDDHVNEPSLRVTTTAGANIGNFRAQTTWRFQESYSRNPSTQAPYSRVSAWNIFDMFFRYDVEGEGVFEDLAFTMNVNNIFDKKPQINGPSTTIGRFVQFGVNKRF
jgi:iron complex outermembrane receptor protein